MFQAGVTQNTVLHLAIFQVFPLQIVGILEINRNVCSLFLKQFITLIMAT